MNVRCAHRWAFSAFGGALAERTDDLSAPRGDEATVRVTHCGICHSDLHFVAGGFDLGQGQKTSITRAGATLPLTMGHEIPGELVELGPQAGHAPASIGERVVVYPWIGCGACGACERGDDHLCTKVSRNLGLQLPGGYADLVRVPHARYLVPIGTLDPARAILYTIWQRICQFDIRRGSSFMHMVSTDGDTIEFRHMGCCKTKNI